MGADNSRTSEGPCIIGLDPGLRVTGYGVVKLVENGHPLLMEAGIIRAPVQKALPERLETIFDGVRELLQNFRPIAVALEEVFSHYQRPRTAILMGHARGVICLAAGQASVPVIAYAPTQVKRLLTGSGRASKAQMQRAIQRELALPQAPKPADVADALALALCHAYRIRRDALVGSAASLPDAF